MQITFEALQSQFGKYNNEQGEFVLTQDAYPDTNAGSNVIANIIMPGESYYRANGFDRDGNSVMLVWEITDEDAEDASDACDWTEFTAIWTSGDPAPWQIMADAE